MKQLGTNTIVNNFLKELLKMSSSIPTKMEVENLINNFYNENNISVETSGELDMVLQSFGVDKINKEGLNTYAANLITQKSGLPIEHSARVISGVRTLISNLLERRQLQEQVNLLKSSNSQREIALMRELEICNQEIDNRITAQNLLISHYKSEISKEDLTAEQLIVATENFLGFEVDKRQIKEDIENLLNGDTNIIIEL